MLHYSFELKIRIFPFFFILLLPEYGITEQENKLTLFYKLIKIYVYCTSDILFPKQKTLPNRGRVTIPNSHKRFYFNLFMYSFKDLWDTREAKCKMISSVPRGVHYSYVQCHVRLPDYEYVPGTVIVWTCWWILEVKLPVTISWGGEREVHTKRNILLVSLVLHVTPKSFKIQRDGF